MFGLVATRATALSRWLAEGEASLKTLSMEHADGWGVASHAGDAGWSIEKHPACAARCPRFASVASEAHAAHVIAHVRKATVGSNALENTHPFVRGRYAFAHNGTIPRVAALDARTSSTRRAEIRGQTDSERFFAFLLTRVDETDDPARAAADAVREIRAIADFGSATFLFSDGAQMLAYRQGRSLFSSACDRAGAAMLASEPLGDVPWVEVREGALVCLETGCATVREIELDRSAGLSLRAG